MKTIKYLASAATAAILALGAPFAASAAANGNIYSIQPLDEAGGYITSSGYSAENPMRAGEKATFVVRFIKPSQSAPHWRLSYTGASSELLENALNPLSIGIIVSGKPRSAKLVSSKLTANGYITDFVFEYVIEPGDFALPIVLANKDGEPASNKVVADPSYYIMPGSRDVWRIDDGGSTVAQWWFNADDDGMNMYGDGNRVRDVSLRDAKFYVKTIDFDSKFEVSDSDPTRRIWRTVHEGGAVTGGAVPTLELSGVPTRAASLYVWSEEQSGVRIEGGVQMPIHTSQGVTVTRFVKEIKIEAGKSVYPFEIFGLAEGNTDTLVLSEFPDFNYWESGQRISDYVTVKVRCSGPLPRTIQVAPELTMVTANSAFLTSVTKLNVRLTQPYDEDVEVKITPSMFGSGAAADNWINYVRLSTSPTVTSLPDTTVPVVTIRRGERESDTPLFIFALRSDANTTGTGNGIQFIPTTTYAGTSANEGWGKAQGDLTIEAQDPVIVEPAEGDRSLATTAGNDCPLSIKVSDTYADMTSTDGYEIYIRKHATEDNVFTKLEGRYMPGRNGYLYKVENGAVTDKLPTVVYQVTEPAENKSIIYVKSPVSGNESEWRNFVCTVAAQAGFSIQAFNASGEPQASYKEGDDVTIEVKLDRKNDTGKDLYAFLVPESEKDKNAVECDFLNDGVCNGLRIPAGGNDVSGGIRLVDGGATVTSSQFRYSMVLCSSQTYAEDSVVAKFACKNMLTLKSSNVIPKVLHAKMGQNKTGEDGKFRDGVVAAMGVKQMFTAVIDEPGTFDRTATGDSAFKTRWTFEPPSGPNRGPENGDADYVVKGDPETTAAEFSFNRAGEWKVIVELKDKDMASFGNGELRGVYEFYVTVVDKPAITVTGRTEAGDEAVSFYENESADAGGGAYIDVNLAMNNCDFDLKVELEVKSGDASAENAGKFILREVPGKVDKKSGSDNVYVITFAPFETTVPIIVKTLDGTAVSKTLGFVLTPVMLPAESGKTVPDSGDQKAEDYFVGTAKTLKIYNSDPVIEEADLFPVPGTTNLVAIGTADPIEWNFTDVAADFEGGITVTVKGGGGYGPVTVKNAGEANGKFAPTFDKSGPHTVQLSVQDKDGRPVSFTWYYEVEAAKTLSIVAHGPAGGNGTANSKRYRTAAGLGEGRVWADGLSNIKSFESFFNCGRTATWTAYGRGYKVDEVDESINTLGNRKGGADPAYVYAAASDKNGQKVDSFLYTWLQVMAAEEGGSLTDQIFGGATSPEYSALAASGTRVALPSEQNEDGSFLDTMLEAVFSREYLASDNMGDINQDGIPDIFVDKYGMGVVDTATGLMTGDDLASLRGFNDDLAASDFLPAHATSSFGGLIPGLEESWATLGIPFSAFLEIRGYGEGLNDAPAIAGIPNVSPDRVYTDPTADPASTLSYVEFLAWEEFAAANGLDVASAEAWKLWSPERPTDPMKADTDDDGFSDGYEYYFWYRAHVGYIDAAGNHRYLTGRAYDPRNPGEGRHISSAEIAALMDPITPSGDAASAATRDTDNDGLPDLLEFMIGTDPFNFDTDGDGLADGWELMIAGTSPVLASSYLDAKLDTERNYDGDAMAFTTQLREYDVMPKPLVVQERVTFAVIDVNGDTDGKQWYVVKDGDEAAVTYELDETATGTLLTIGGVKYIATADVKVTAGNRLAASLARGAVYTVAAAAEVAELVPGVTVEYLRLAPVSLEAGLKLDEAPVPDTAYAVASIATAPEDGKCNAAWVYGNPALEGYGMLALARYQTPEVGAVLCEVPSKDREVALLHSLVYQEYGFDPRTAWSDKSPLAARWGTTSSDGEAVEGVYVAKQGGYVANAARTRAYAMYDEFLVYSFFLNNGVDMTGTTYVPASAPSLAQVWGAFTTNPQGPGEPGITAEENYYGRNSEEGADTDLDGVPDGWELYTMAGPKDKDGRYVFAPPYAGFATALSTDSEKTYITSSSYWSPFVAEADKNTTDNQLYLGGQGNSDGLNQRREFGGTDSCAHYAECSTTITRHESDLKWLNKFFPTDPWSADTDGDGIKDNVEGTTFVYGSPADNGKLWSIPGGGLNPCATDTDLDGLPDPWENQYKGKTVYAGEDADYAADTVEGAKGNPLQGLTDGMDGTVCDSYSVPATLTVRESDGRIWSGKVCRDYDRDGLENWQEYMTGTMRCWRYDDPFSPWTAIPKETYFTYNDEEEEWVFNADDAAQKLGCASADEFWYKTLVDKSSGIYNPYLVTDCSQGWQYFTPVTNTWDLAYPVEGAAYYYFSDSVNGEKINKAWGEAHGLEKVPGTIKYVGCSPLKADSDQDGMDDYYELFHGMNPLLGESGVEVSSNGPCDLIADAWSTTDGVTIEAWSDDLDANFWTQQVKAGNFYKTGKAPKGNGYDFEYYPWLSGAATADPDGDDIRNQQEAIIPTANINAKHTDPTPLWMTDSSYSNSFVRMFYRMPARFDEVALSADSFSNPNNPDEVFYFRDFAGYVPPNPAAMEPAKFAAFSPDAWNLAAAGKENWMFSFEENEGFDSDHDGMSDNDESSSRFRDASDALDFDSPRRRQAMYFGGSCNPSVLQTLPFEKERHPVSTSAYPENTDFCHFTVECWVKAESLADATVVERAIRVEKSNPGDNSYIRRNFHLGIKNGKWYAAYDSAGTFAGSVVGAEGIAATADWTHLAATYDGTALKLYVNGVPVANTLSSVDPEYGASALALHDVSVFWGVRNYDLVATILGASVKRGDDGRFGSALALTSGDAVSFKNLSAYENFFQGWIDEVRIWDGARSGDEIAETMKVRFTAEEAAANREAVFNEWKVGNRRYVAGNTARPELRYHYNFDALFGAMTSAESDLRRTPNGFTDGNVAKADISRPDDWQISWLAPVLEAHGSAYRCNSEQGDIWATWIHNTVTHLPRFDGTTLDSFYWSKDFEGWKVGRYSFPQTAEPYSKWTQMVYNNAITAASGEFGGYAVPGARFSLILGNPSAQGYDAGTNGSFNVDYKSRFEFTGRNLYQQGDDMLALGGAFAKYAETMWDDNGPSAPWEYTGVSSSLDGIPEWWQEYAFANYDQDGAYTMASEIKWDSVVTWNGLKMDARSAYWRDLAAGMMLENGDIVMKTEFAQTADINGDGLADWWENLFGISAAEIADDTDNDGLADFAEYLVSEVFKFAQLNPRMARSDGYRLDCFGKIGSLYFGEILSDHDFMEDWWESIYSVKNISSGVYDPHVDGDGDGWSNFAECRAGTSPDRISYLGVDEATMSDYPVPVVKLTCSYRGGQNAAVYPVVVKAYSKKSNSSMPDAVWNIAALVGTGGGENAAGGASAGNGAGEGEDAGAAGDVRQKQLGMNPGSVVKLNLGPGSVVVGSLSVNFKDLTWETETLHYEEDSFSVVATEVGESGDATWLKGVVDQARAGDTVHGDLIIVYADMDASTVREVVGQINYQTGEVTLDLSKLQGRYYYDREVITESSSGGASSSYWVEHKCAELSRSYVRIDWSSKQTTTGYPKTFYLADAEINSVEKPSHGHLYEGENWFEAFVDMDGDGHYSAGEPYGFKRGVNIGWSGTEFDIELTDTSPVFGRLRFDGSGWSCDRVALYGSEAAVEINSNGIAGAMSKITRARVVRASVNGITLLGDESAVVRDFNISLDTRPYITEADILGEGQFDIEDLGAFSTYNEETITSISYAVVLGDQPLSAGLSGNLVVPYYSRRNFDSEYQSPLVVSEGIATVFYGARPSFTWTMKGLGTYPTFKIQVQDSAGTVIYDSGNRLAPECDAAGNYTWTPDDLYVDDQCVNGSLTSVFSNMRQYTWRVQMNNVKFGKNDRFWSARSHAFRMNVNTAAEANDSGYSCVKAAVKYFGPKEVLGSVLSLGAQGKIRVEAFVSPDFTGVPVARGFFAGDAASLTNDDYSANVVLKGIPSGSYYLRAYIDTDGDFKRSVWESWGYANRRDMTSGRNIFTPVPVTVGPDVAAAPLARIYIEDADTDGDWLPDAWEWTTSGGSLTAKGPGEFFDSNVFGFADDFQKRFSRVSASGNPLGSNLRALSTGSINSSDMTALLLGVDTTGYDSSAAALSAYVSPELAENGVCVESLKIEGGKVTIKVSGRTVPPAAANAGSSFYTVNAVTDGTLQVTCNVYVKETLAAESWTLAVSERITVGGEAVEILADKAGAASGFYKVELVK